MTGAADAPPRAPAGSGVSTGPFSADDLPAVDLPLVRLLGETRALVVDRLRTGARSIAELAADLDLSEEAVRRHLRQLEQDGLVSSELQHGGGRGRPRSLYRLSDGGRRLYPDRSGELANELWEYLENEHGRRAVLGFLRWRRGRQAGRYAEQLAELPEGASSRAGRLAELLTEDGFLARAEVVTTADGSRTLQLTQSHCAVRQMAAEHPEICAHEAAMFRDLLGARVSRRQTIARGAHHCVCTVEETESTADAPPSDPPHDDPVPDDRALNTGTTVSPERRSQENRHGDAS